MKTENFLLMKTPLAFFLFVKPLLKTRSPFGANYCVKFWVGLQIEFHSRFGVEMHGANAAYAYYKLSVYSVENVRVNHCFKFFERVIDGVAWPLVGNQKH